MTILSQVPTEDLIAMLARERRRWRKAQGMMYHLERKGHEQSVVESWEGVARDAEIWGTQARLELEKRGISA